MSKSRLYRILSRIVEIKPGEELIAIFLFFYFFLITAPHTIIKSVRDARYLIDMGSIKLPIAYLLTAVLMGFVVAFHSKLQVRVQRSILIISSLVFFIITCFIFGLLIIQGWTWVPLVFWIWANILVIVLMTQFWFLVNDVFNPREAKRLIGFFVSGGILGGIFGGLLTGLLAFDYLDSLLFIATGLLISSVFVVNYIFIWQRKKQLIPIKTDKKDKGGMNEAPKVGFKDCFNTVRKNYYLKLLAAVVTITLIVSTFIDWQSKNVIEKVVRDVNLTEFFGYFNAGLLVVPFFLQLFLTSRFIKRYGIRVALLLFPFILLLGSLGIAAFFGIYFAIILKGSDKSLSYSLNQSVRELLYIPVSPELKYKAKIFIDMFLNRFAKGIGALILMIFIFIPTEWTLRVRIVSIISVVFILAWAFLNLKLSKEYTNTVKQKLEVKWDRVDREVAEKVDIDYTKLVFDTLESKNRSSVLYAMHLFDLIKQDKLTPEVKKLISYKSDEIRASSLGALFDAEETTWLPETDDYLDEEVLGKEIQEIMSLDVYKEVMEDYIGKVVLDKGIETETEKMEVAKAMGLMESNSTLVDTLEDLIRDESPDVSRYAVESAAKLKRREYVPAIIEKMLSPLTREDASAALEKYGSKIIGTLADYLGDSEEDIEVRRATASVLARIGTQDTADLLSWELAEDGEDIENALIDGLDKIRYEKPDVRFSKEIVEPKIVKNVKIYYQMFVEHYDSKSKKKKDDISEVLPKNLSIAIMDIFKLLELIYPREDIIRAYQNVRTGTKDSVAYAVELLDNILKKELKDVIFPIIENLSLEERVRRCRSLLKSFTD